ncbi:MAG: preprotein translocase subunit SecG [Candidatus Marinimicrobia bacterium]|nr:preprotein translocase subunit SecG [Candidatus Neomarinimicrobiota bacterium]
MLVLLITIHAIISLLLITVVLMQSSQGGGLAGSIGGQTTNAIFGGRGAATALSKMTTYLAISFMGIALLISLVSSPDSSGVDSVIEQAQEERTLAPTSDGLALPISPIQKTEENKN